MLAVSVSGQSLPRQRPHERPTYAATVTAMLLAEALQGRLPEGVMRHGSHAQGERDGAMDERKQPSVRTDHSAYFQHPDASDRVLSSEETYRKLRKARMGETLQSRIPRSRLTRQECPTTTADRRLDYLYKLDTTADRWYDVAQQCTEDSRASLVQEIKSYYEKITTSALAETSLWRPIIRLGRKLQRLSSLIPSQLHSGMSLHHASVLEQRNQLVSTLEELLSTCVAISEIIGPIPKSLLSSLTRSFGYLGSIDNIKRCFVQEAGASMQASSGLDRFDLNLAALREYLNASCDMIRFMRTWERVSKKPAGVSVLDTVHLREGVQTFVQTGIADRLNSFALELEKAPKEIRAIANSRLLRFMQFDMVPKLPIIFDRLDEVSLLIHTLSPALSQIKKRSDDHLRANTSEFTRPSSEASGSNRQSKNYVKSPSDGQNESIKPDHLGDSGSSRAPLGVSQPRSLLSRRIVSERLINELEALQNEFKASFSTSESESVGKPKDTSSLMSMFPVFQPQWDISRIDLQPFAQTVADAPLPAYLVPQPSGSISQSERPRTSSSSDPARVSSELAIELVRVIARLPDDHAKELLERAGAYVIGTRGNKHHEVDDSFKQNPCWPYIISGLTTLYQMDYLNCRTPSALQKVTECLNELAKKRAHVGDIDGSLAMITLLSTLPSEWANLGLLPNTNLTTIRSLIIASASKRDLELMWSLVRAELGRRGFCSHAPKYTRAWMRQFHNQAPSHSSVGGLDSNSTQPTSTPTLPFSIIVPFAIVHSLKLHDDLTYRSASGRDKTKRHQGSAVALGHSASAYMASLEYISDPNAYANCRWDRQMSRGLFTSLVHATLKFPQGLLANVLEIFEALEGMHSNRLSAQQSHDLTLFDRAHQLGVLDLSTNPKGLQSSLPRLIDQQTRQINHPLIIDVSRLPFSPSSQIRPSPSLLKNASIQAQLFGFVPLYTPWSTFSRLITAVMLRGDVIRAMDMLSSHQHRFETAYSSYRRHAEKGTWAKLEPFLVTLIRNARIVQHPHSLLRGNPQDPLQTKPGSISDSAIQPLLNHGAWATHNMIKPIIALIKGVPMGRATRDLRMILEMVASTLQLPVTLAGANAQGINLETYAALVDSLAGLLLSSVLERRGRYQFAPRLHSGEAEEGEIAFDEEIERLRKECRLVAQTFIECLLYTKLDPLHQLEHRAYSIK